MGLRRGSLKKRKEGVKETEAEGGQREVEVRISAGGGDGVLAEFFYLFFFPEEKSIATRLAVPRTSAPPRFSP